MGAPPAGGRATPSTPALPASCRPPQGGVCQYSTYGGIPIYTNTLYIAANAGQLGHMVSRYVNLEAYHAGFTRKRHKGGQPLHKA